MPAVASPTAAGTITQLQREIRDHDQRITRVQNDLEHLVGDLGAIGADPRIGDRLAAALELVRVAAAIAADECGDPTFGAQS